MIKDLDVFNMFMLIIFEEGISNNFVMSYYFNILRCGEGIFNFQQLFEIIMKFLIEIMVIFSFGLLMIIVISDGFGVIFDVGGIIKDEFFNQ